MTVNINGQTIHYEITGEGGETVLFLHGWGAPITAYAPVLELLSRRFRVVAFDMPGVGQSPEPTEPLTLDGYVDLTLGLCRAVGVTEAVIVCHSHGGRIAVRLLSDPTCPVRCARAVFIDAAGVVPQRSAWWKLRRKAYKVLRVLGTNRLTAPLFQERYEVTRDRRSSADYRAASPVMRKTLSNVVGCDMTPLMPRITADVLLVWGENDPDTPLSAGRIMESLIPGSGLAVIKNAGHFPFVAGRAQFEAVLKAYFEIEQ